MRESVSSASCIRSARRGPHAAVSVAFERQMLRACGTAYLRQLQREARGHGLAVLCVVVAVLVVLAVRLAHG